MGKLTQRVALENIRFYAYHGFYKEEQTLGSLFYVDVEAFFQVQEAGKDEIENTVNYEVLFDIVKEEMKAVRKLLETVAFDILQKIQSQFPFCERIVVKIKKKHPPMAGEIEQSVVELEYKA